MIEQHSEEENRGFFKGFVERFEYRGDAILGSHRVWKERTKPTYDWGGSDVQYTLYECRKGVAVTTQVYNLFMISKR